MNKQNKHRTQTTQMNKQQTHNTDYTDEQAKQNTTEKTGYELLLYMFALKYFKLQI
jgi:hypothetical protein